MSTRSLQRIIRSIPASDGAGVKLRRSLGQSPFQQVDPFLMLDEMSSDNPDDYMAGFPSHPHRGFETVTYLLEGHMLHQDHLGNHGDLRSGGVQWMTAGRGIIHSEMPQQENGRLHGFQLWINLPAVEKMKPAAYRDIQPDEIPQVALAGGGTAKLIAGTLDIEGKMAHGPMQGLSTNPLFIDVRLSAGDIFSTPFQPHTARSFIRTRANSRLEIPPQPSRCWRMKPAYYPAGSALRPEQASMELAFSCLQPALWARRSFRTALS